MKVDVYWNLNKNCLSVRHKGKVIAHVQRCALENVEFVVQPAGNARVRREHRKNVHAFARGTLLEVTHLQSRTFQKTQAFYNPYKYTTFCDVDSKKPIRVADFAWMTTKRNETHDITGPNVRYHNIVQDSE